MPPRQLSVISHGKSPNWYLRWWEPKAAGGWKERWKSTRTTDKKDAERQRRKLERELESGRKSHDDPTWDGFVELFVDVYGARRPATTMGLYEHCLRTFGYLACPKRLSAVDRTLIEDFANDRLKLGAAPATVNRDLRHLRAALRWAKRRGLVGDAPDFHGIFVKEPRRKPTIIPEEDFAAILKTLKSPSLKLKHRPAAWWRIFLYLAYYLGLRRGELLSLTWADVDLTNLEIRVVAATSKGRRERTVPISKDLALIVEPWRKESNASASEEVLPWPEDNYRQLYDDWHAIQKEAGIPDDKHYLPKNCRSTCASALIASNVPTVVVKDFLGHATVTTTENYYINTKPALRAAANARNILPE
ncbi:MAG: tyrosine-type recombinase/integrase [Pirellulales bacterium]|nr:tyrosine-type recombinase/integrase [Pirellulales bacterium]